jgi:hypothetical protein
MTFSLVLVAALLIYLPGLGGPFLFDDQTNFLQNNFVHMSQLDVDSALDAAFSGGGHFPSRGISRLSFALNYYFAGGTFDPREFKFVNLLIHLLNAVLVFAIARVLFLQYANRFDISRVQAMWMATLCASLWVLHPLQLTSVLYAVQRMTSLSALFTFAGLLGYVYGRQAVQRGDDVRGFVLMGLGLGCGVVLGVLNKENAALLPFLAYVVHLAFFPTSALDSRSRRRLRVFHLLFVGSALVIALSAVVWSWNGFLSAYELRRDFSMSERLLTQPRVLFFYLSLLLFPGLRRMSLYHDDFIVSTGLLSPASTLLAIAALVVLSAFALYRLRSGALWAFGIVFFLLGHAIESSFVPLEMVFEHRNYLPSFALALFLAWALVRFTQRTSAPVVLAVTISLAVVSGLSTVTWARVGIWSNETWLMQFMVEHQPNSYRARAVSARLEAARSGSVSGIFTAYSKIAHTNPSAIFPLMRMRRAMNAMQFQLREGMMPSSVVPADAVSSIRWDAPALYRNLPYLDQLAGAVDEEIRRRLRRSAVSDETLAEFRQIRKCIDARMDLCIGLDDELYGWLQVTLTQSKMDTGARVRILDELAWSYEREGDFSRAHAALTEATRLRPSTTHYELRRVLLYVRQQELDEAEELLKHIESVEGRSRTDRTLTSRTRERLAGAFERNRLQRDAPGAGTVR